MRLFLTLLCLLLPLSPKAEELRPLRIVTSFSILEDMAKQLGGDAVEVHSLIPRAVDAHGFDPKPSDAKALKSADLVIVNGLGFDDWMAKLIQASGYKGKVVVATDTIVPITRATARDDTTPATADPHAWHSFANAEIYARNITTALAGTDPKRADYYSSRLSGYILRIRELRTQISRKLAAIAADRRTVAVPHNTFAYFGRDYRITFYSPQGLSTLEEPSAADVRRIVDDMRTRNIRAAFEENVGHSTLLRRIAEEAAIPISGQLYTDALSDEKGEAGTYLQMMGLNADRLAKALAVSDKK